MRFLDLHHPWFIPLWRRVLVTAFCAAWTLVELVSGGPFWVILFAALTVVCGYQFFIAFTPREPD